MGLFDKKYCDFCGNKIGLLGNKKLEDGNMCKECASKLSPWFSDRRHSTKDEIQAQLDYREANKSKVAAFQTTKSIGKYTKLLLDENKKQFMVTSASDLLKANPDVLEFSDAVGCELDVDESRYELKHKNAEGKEVSYNPPKYEYSYAFYVKILVNNPYFDDIRYSLSNGHFKTGERPLNANAAAWRVNQAFPGREKEYYEYLNMGNEIKETIDRMQQQTYIDNAVQSAQPAAPTEAAGLEPVICPFCGLNTIPNAEGKCEHCGAPLGE